ncbi:MAG TPA: bifunctional nicotinamidase/pyrazinamidase [Myxococcales bacterium]|nr:bifunctional nicotinamidase/pyrazinamidase [Myxococcales bacterium]HET9754208.1 bifunctional nicotinamidase/pyrazinamidase [Myxococcales bacterium]
MRALILVDIQNDFLPGGALAVPRGDEVVPVANLAQQEFALVVATQDWHPREHGSFASQHPGRSPGELSELAGLPQVLWPDHCAQGSHGAAFAAALDLRRVEAIFRKGTDPRIDSYSAFFDNGHRKSTGLGDYLRGRGAGEVHVMGLALDYCVKFTALDAQELGFRTFVHLEGSRGVDLRPGDVDRAVEELRAAGVQVVRGTTAAP